MAYVNMPGVFQEKVDGRTIVFNPSDAERILVLGTAGSGVADALYPVRRSQLATSEFGSTGTLLRGMFEVKAAGGENIILFRMGATSAKLEGIGVNAATGGITIETVEKDASAADNYELYWNNTTHRLVVRNVASETVVFDRDFDEVTASIDLGEVYVTGTYTQGEGAHLGDASTFVTMHQVGDAEVSGGSDTSCTLTHGTDGSNPSRMELYEYLFKTYILLENASFDFVVPMDVYLDDDNVVDGDTYSASPGTVYPTVGSADDILLYFYAEEYQGEWYFWWRDSKNSGAADIYPSATYRYTTPSGVDIATTIFSEVNFAHQLASFCYDISSDSNECHGFVGVKAPDSFSLRDVANWIGKLPTYTLQSDGTYKINASADNGTGLLGNKFMAGKYGFRSGVGGGGFIATDDGFCDGTELTDDGGHVIDIGAYLSVVGAWPTLYNKFDVQGRGYTTTGAASYAGFASSLAPKSAPTNKVVTFCSLPFDINLSRMDDLVGVRYVMFKNKPKGTVVVDAPTAARPDSDFRRLTTVRIVKDVIDGIRRVADPFLGEPGGAARRMALQTAIENEIMRQQKDGAITRHELSVTASAAEAVLGQVTVQVTLVPAWETRQITIVLQLAAS